MSGELVTAVLSEAYRRFNGFPADRQQEIALWVRRRVEAIKSGASVPSVVPDKPRMLDRSWYDAPEREPGDES